MKAEALYIEVINKLSQIRNDEEKLRVILERVNHVLEEVKQEGTPKIPAEYESIVTQIAESLWNGFICFLNPETLEIEQVADEGYYGFTEAEYDEQNEDMVDEYGLTYPEWDRYVRFEPFGRNDLLNRIDQFIQDLGDEPLRTQLGDFSDTEELIRQFPEILERTGYTRDWTIFLKSEIEVYVKDQLIDTLEKKTNSEEDIYSLSS